MGRKRNDGVLRPLNGREERVMKARRDEARRAVPRDLLRVVVRLAATTALAARSVVTAVLRRRKAGADGKSRERGDAQYNFRNVFHCNSPVLNFLGWRF